MLTKKDFDMIEDLFDQKFDEKFENKFEDKFEKKFAPVLEKLDTLIDMVDGLAGNQRKDEEERIILSHQVERHENRINKIENIVSSIK